MKTMTFNLLLCPSFPPSIFPPSIIADLFHFLNDFLLLQSLCSQFRAQPRLVAGATHCDRWNESPEKSHLLINAPRHSASQKKEVFFPFFLSCQQTGAGGDVSCYLKTIWCFATVNQSCSLQHGAAEAASFAYKCKRSCWVSFSTCAEMSSVIVTSRLTASNVQHF